MSKIILKSIVVVVAAYCKVMFQKGMCMTLVLSICEVTLHSRVSMKVKIQSTLSR